MTQGGARQKRRGLTRWGEVGLHPPGRCRTAHHRPASEEPATPSHRCGRRPGSTNAPREQPSGPQTVRGKVTASPPRRRDFPGAAVGGPGDAGLSQPRSLSGGDHPAPPLMQGSHSAPRLPAHAHGDLFSGLTFSVPP